MASKSSVKLGSVLLKTALATGGLAVLYRTVVPSEEEIEKYLVEERGDQSDDLRRLRDLSVKGYSYKAITEIIKKEKFERIEALLQKEKEEKILRGEPVEDEAPFARKNDGKLKGFLPDGTAKERGFGEVK